MQTITIHCPRCEGELEMETAAPQTCEVHHWHAHPGDSTICTECRWEWVVADCAAIQATPRNREVHYNAKTAIDACNDRFLVVRFDKKERNK